MRNAVGAVASSAVAHESYPIDTVPWGIGVSDDGHSAVASYETSTVELLSPTGEVERVVRYLPENEPWELAAIALSPDHSTLVVTTAEGISTISYNDAVQSRDSSNAQLSVALGAGIGAGVAGVLAGILFGVE